MKENQATNLSQLFSLQERVALVTGATGHLGQEMVIALAMAGAHVIINSRSEQKLQLLADKLSNMGREATILPLDITDRAAITKRVPQLLERFGKLDILVNNAGVTHDNLLLRMKDEEWENTIETNLTGVYRVTKACLRGMLKAKWGRIISISSVVGATGNPGQANYSATKAGVIAFSKSLAKEIASRGITVNVVAPGFIDTDMTRQLSDEQRHALLQNIPVGSMGQAQDIAACVAFLASVQAGYITGETIHVNGGMYMG